RMIRRVAAAAVRAANRRADVDGGARPCPRAGVVVHHHRLDRPPILEAKEVLDGLAVVGHPFEMRRHRAERIGLPEMTAGGWGERPHRVEGRSQPLPEPLLGLVATILSLANRAQPGLDL